MIRAETVELRIDHAAEPARLIGRLRREVMPPVGVLSANIRDHSPIQVSTLYGLDHIESKRKLLSLIADLDAASVGFAILVGGEAVSREYLHNILRRWHEISYDVAMEAELELGEDNEEADRWATGKIEYPPEEE